MTARMTPLRGFLARRGWPLGIAFVLGLTVAGDLWMMSIASADPSFAVEPDYYRKAVTWDSTMAQARANAASGWRAAADLVLARPGIPGRITVTLTDAGGRGITGASVQVEMMHNARAAQRYSAALQEGAVGRYSADVDAHRPGAWEVRVSADVRGHHFTHVARLDAPAAPASRGN